MLMIRLARFGAKKKPFYRVVVIEKERARNGRNLEVVGHYNPLTASRQGGLESRTHRALDQERRPVVRNRGASGEEESGRRPRRLTPLLNVRKITSSMSGHEVWSSPPLVP